MRGLALLLALGVIRTLAFAHPAGAAMTPGASPQDPDGAALPAARETVWEERERTGMVMGTGMRLVAIGKVGEGELLERALAEAEDELRRVEALMTSWSASALTRLNDGAGQGPQETDREIVGLVARSLRIAAATQGAFDPTWHRLKPLWRFKGEQHALPALADVEDALQYVDWTRVVVDEAANRVELPAGFSLGLGGIAKGYGVDRAMAVLLEHGIEHGLVDAGGDLKVLGRNAGKLWEVAIKHPRRRQDLIAALPVSNTCVVTSGDYERFFELDGKRYHHILDPRTGFPAKGAMSATVLGPDAAACDALATALCVLGPKDGLQVIADADRFEALVVDMDGAVHLSAGLNPEWLAGKPDGAALPTDGR